MKKGFTKYITQCLGYFVFVGSMCLLYTNTVSAAPFINNDYTNTNEQLNAAGALDPEASEQPLDPRLVVAYTIRIALSLLGTALFILIVMSGYWYFTARGNDDKVTRAKDTLRQAVMGMVIILVAYAITSYTITSLTVRLKQGNDPAPRDELRFP